MENPDTSERNGYKPINTNPEDELKLHTDGEMPTVENKNNYVETENLPVRRSNRLTNACNRIDTGECDIPKTSGCEKKGKTHVCFRTKPK